MDTASLNQRDRFIPFPALCRDMPVVQVIDNNVEKAIRTLGKATGKLGIFRALKARRLNPAPAARARRKAIEAESHRRRILAKRAKR